MTVVVDRRRELEAPDVELERMRLLAPLIRAGLVVLVDGEPRLTADGDEVAAHLYPFWETS